MENHLTTPAPHWNLLNIYPGLESKEFAADMEKLKRQLDGLEQFFTEQLAATDPQDNLQERSNDLHLAEIASGAIDRLNASYLLSNTLRAYINSFVATNSHNAVATRLMSQYERVNVRLQKLNTRFRGWVGKIAPSLDEIQQLSATARAHAFMLRESAEQAQYLMSEVEEALAAELNLSGGNAWNKLQNVITSQLTIDFELDGRVQKLPMPALINLHSHPDEAVRRARL